MSIFLSILLVVVILIVLVLVHEFGHFSIAKFFGIRVDQFNVGFPPRLLKIQKGETLYSFNLLLLGGYVQIHGENPEDAAGDPRALSSKSRPVQAAVLFGGILFNLIFAWLILSGGYMWGLPTSVDHEGVGQVANAHPVITSVLPGSPADKAGLMPLDAIVSIQTATQQLAAYNSDASTTFAFITGHAGDSLVITVMRDGAQHTYLARAMADVVPADPTEKVIGITLDDVGTLRLSPPLALWEGGILAKNIIVDSAQGLGTFLYGLARGTPDFSNASGPIGIVSYGGMALKEGATEVLILAASISIALGIFNLLPIPGLDGGRLFILLIESIMRRPASPRVVTSLTFAGFALLILLMVVVSYHDVIKLVG